MRKMKNCINSIASSRFFRIHQQNGSTLSWPGIRMSPLPCFSSAGKEKNSAVSGFAVCIPITAFAIDLWPPVSCSLPASASLNFKRAKKSSPLFFRQISLHLPHMGMPVFFLPPGRVSSRKDISVSPGPDKGKDCLCFFSCVLDNLPCTGKNGTMGKD